VHGIMLKVATVSTKNLSLVNSSVKKINPALAGKCITVAVACAGMAAEPERFGGTLVFRKSTGCNTPVCSVGVIVVKLAHAIGRVLESMKSRAGKWATFGTGVAVPFVGRLPASGSRAPTSVSRGGRDCRVAAASSILQGVHGSLVVSCAYCFSHGWR
jgi:hypothetical protein